MIVLVNNLQYHSQSGKSESENTSPQYKKGITVRVAALRVRVSLNNQQSYCQGGRSERESLPQQKLSHCQVGMSESEIVTQKSTVSGSGWHV